MATSQAEHATFTRGMEEAWSYVRRCRASIPGSKRSPIPEPAFEHLTDVPPNTTTVPVAELRGSTFDPHHFRQQLDTWTPCMLAHLSNEVDILTIEFAQKAGKSFHDEYKVLLRQHTRSLDPTIHAVSTVGSYPMRTCGQFMDMPVFVRRILIPVRLLTSDAEFSADLPYQLIWSGKHWGMWRYLPHPEVS